MESNLETRVETVPETLAEMATYEESDRYRPVPIRPRKIQEQYPILSAEDPEVAKVSMGYFGITDHYDEKPIIATSSLIDCIGLLGYDRQNGIGFLMHVNGTKSVDGAFDKLYEELNRKYPDLTKQFDVQIVTSNKHYRPRLRDLERNLQTNASRDNTKLSYTNRIEFVPDSERKGKPVEGVALDTRDGTIFAYLSDDFASLIDALPKSSGPLKYNHPIPSLFWE